MSPLSLHLTIDWDAPQDFSSAWLKVVHSVRTKQWPFWTELVQAHQHFYGHAPDRHALTQWEEGGIGGEDQATGRAIVGESGAALWIKHPTKVFPPLLPDTLVFDPVDAYNDTDVWNGKDLAEWKTTMEHVLNQRVYSIATPGHTGENCITGSFVVKGGVDDVQKAAAMLRFS
tara:strand:- start:110 stop:628 length:519 start_codon:yes stop_codon:yes gene_type:complete